jgi:hypothetical protein
MHITVKLPFKVSLYTNGFYHRTEEGFVWRQFVTKFECNHSN